MVFDNDYFKNLTDDICSGSGFLWMQLYKVQLPASQVYAGTYLNFVRFKPFEWLDKPNWYIDFDSMTGGLNVTMPFSDWEDYWVAIKK